ncbi:MAG: amidohydrolase family protein [Candidatus Firestonebacteria bacterium]
MFIDVHHHLGKEKNYKHLLYNEAKKLKLDKVCLMGLPDFYNWSTNKEIYSALKTYPDMFIGFACFNLGRGDKVDDLKRFKDKGFKGIKFIVPKKDYDDRSFYPIYKKMEKLNLIALFHTGIVLRKDEDKKYDIDNDRMRPIYLDTIARAFPNLTIICAHLGNPWYEEASMSLRWNPNLYADLTGSTLKRLSPDQIESLLWWKKTSRYKDPLGRGAWEKIVFGSDVPYYEIYDVYNDYKKIMNMLDVKKNKQEKVFGNTMANLLKLND